jgi:hypothetical protein
MSRIRYTDAHQAVALIGPILRQKRLSVRVLKGRRSIMPPLLLQALEFGIYLLFFIAFVLRFRSHCPPLANLREDRMAWRLAIAAGIAGSAWTGTYMAYAIFAQIGRLHR